MSVAPADASPGTSPGPPTTRSPRGPVDSDLLRLVPELRRHLVVSAAASLVITFAVLSQAEVLARGLARVVGAADSGPSTPSMLGALAAVAVVRALVAWAIERSAASTMAAARRRIREAVIVHAVAGGDRGAGGLGAREATVVTSGVDQMEPYVRQYLPALTQAAALPLVAGLRIALADWISAAIVLVTVPLIPIFMILIGRMTERRAQRSWAVLQRLGGHFLDVLEGLPTLRLFGRAEAQARQVRDVSETYRATTMRTLRVAMLSALTLELLATLSVAVIAVAVGLRMLDGGVDLTTGLVVLLLAPECYLPLRRVGASFHAAQNGLDAAADVGGLLERPIPPVGELPVPSDLTIEVSDVSVERANVPFDGTLLVRPGEVAALVGPSGSGKSTLIDAIRGRLVGRHGSVTVGGRDVAELDPDGWADRLAVILQRPEVTAATVGDEVTGGDESLVPYRDDALAQVGLDALAGLVDRAPTELSGGQFRRVQVARAIVAVRSGRAGVVLADEPTAQLDAEAAASVRTALRQLAGLGAVVVVATHDPQMAGEADLSVDVAREPGDARPSTDAASDAEARASGGDAERTERSDGLLPGHGVDGRPDDAPPVARRTDQTTSAARALSTAGDDRSLAQVVAALRTVLATASPARRRMLGAAALGTLAEICALGLAGVSAWLIVRASEQPDLAAVSLAVVGVRGFGVGKGVFRYAERLATHDAGLRALTDLRATVVDRFAAVAPAGTPDWRRGDVAGRVVDDVDRLLDLYVRVLVPTISIAAATAGAAIVTVLIDPLAALILLVGVAVMTIAIPLVTMVNEHSVTGPLTIARAAVRSEVLELTERADDLVAHRLVDGRRRAIDTAAERVDHLERRRARLREVTSAAIAAVPALVVAATLWRLGDDPTLAAPLVGVLVLWPLATMELDSAVNDAAAAVPSIGDAAGRVADVLALRPPTVERPDLVPDDEPTIRLDELQVVWPATGQGVGPVDLELLPGSTAAVVGPSGSGKSTLAAALVRFCPTTAGHYRITADDGTLADATTIDGDGVRTAVTWVEQAPWIADTNVRENLRIADRSASDADMVDALRAVGLDRWLDGLPHGLDTPVGRHGTSMSGGEAHRLALARMLLASHPVVLLDEPTSHLDAETARLVIDALVERLDDRSVVLLAHAAPDRALDTTLHLHPASGR